MVDKEKQQFEEILQAEELDLTLKEVERIATSSVVLNRYEKKYGKALYPMLLMALTHESYDESEAFDLWKECLFHLEALNRALNRHVGIAVATLDYLSNIKNTLLDPKIIEEEKSAFISQTSTKDELTGLFVREVFDVVLHKAVEESKRKKAELCLLMIDLDDFKQINDQHGHLEGDNVLSKVGACINDSIRQMDLAARYGGEELVVIMPETNQEKALAVAERIRQKVEALTFDGFQITVSIGLSQYSQTHNVPKTIIASGDQALYKAKANGKNQVQFAEESVLDG